MYMARRHATAGARRGSGTWELIKTVFWALLIAGAFRTVLFQPFSIPSGSMKPTLLVGDYLFVSKYSYGYSRYSLPFSPDLFDGRILGQMPERGDVIVFKHPQKDTCSRGVLDLLGDLVRLLTSTTRPAGTEDCVDYVKRLIGLPGDRIQMIAGVLHINGEPVGIRSAGDCVEPLNGASDRCIERRVRAGVRVCVNELWIETLPEGLQHAVLNANSNTGFPDNTEVYVVPEGTFFFMGDNRDNSMDSRYDVGYVPFENLIGRADLILLSSEGAFWEFWKWRGDRFFKSIE